LNHHCSSELASYDVASNICQTHCPTRHGHALGHRLMGYMTSYDLASIVCQTVQRGTRDGASDATDG
jgi:hypothetical protein